MKQLSRYLLALAMAGALLCGGSALAADETPIAVQLDGQELTFTDAVPQVKDQRTFLPFRAIFEAMGAEVSNEGSVITAVQGGRTLTMTLDSTEATLINGDKTTTIVMDVAPYVDNTTWRTYVPVRFAAQAFECAVGWDQENSTVILVDVRRVLDDVLEGKEFTYLEKFMDYSEKYNEGIWDMEATFNADLSVMTMPMTMEGTMEGTVADSEKMDVGMNMKMDLEQFLKSVALLSGEEADLTDEDRALLSSLKNDGIDLTMRGDMAAGKLYMNMKGDFLTAAGMDANTWYGLDMAALMEQAGMDWAELMEASRTLNYLDLAKSALSTLPLTDSTTAYDQVKTTVEQVVDSLSDEGFVKEGNEYTALWEMEENGVSLTVVLVMNMKADAVTSYVMSMHMEATEDDATIAMDMTTGVDDKNLMTAEMNIDMADLLTMQMTMEGKYTQGTTAPAVEPPAGATVVDYMDLMAGGFGSEE